MTIKPRRERYLDCHSFALGMAELLGTNGAVIFKDAQYMALNYGVRSEPNEYGFCEAVCEVDAAEYREKFFYMSDVEFQTAVFECNKRTPVNIIDLGNGRLQLLEWDLEVDDDE